MRFLFILLLCFATFIFVAQNSRAEMSDHPIVKMKALDKSTARTVTFEAKVGSTIEYGSLFIKVQACRKSEPLEKPENAAFLQIWEVPLHAEKSEWVFSGWMFSSSPALSAMDHAVYDVWVLECLDKKKQNKAAKQSEVKKEVEADEKELEQVISETTKEDEPKKSSTIEADEDISSAP